MFAIFALPLEGAILVPDPLLVYRLSRIQIERMAPLLLWYSISKVLFSSFHLKFSQYYTWVMKNIAKQKKKKCSINFAYYVSVVERVH